MSAEPVTSDVIGLTKVAPLSRRGFMTASAAVTAGYTLAAGPVRAGRDPHRHQTASAPAIRRSKWPMARCPVILRGRPASATRQSFWWQMEIFGLHEYIKDVTRRLAKLGAFAIAPDYYFRKGVDLTKVTDLQLLSIVNSKPDAELLSDLDSTVAWAKSQGGDTSRLGNCPDSAVAAGQFGEYAAHSSMLKAGVCVLRAAGRSAKSDLAEEPDGACAGDEGARARSLRWSGYGYRRFPMSKH